MAKKRASKKAEPKSTGNVVVDGIVKKYGNIIQSGTDVLEKLQKYNVLSVSPALDIALGGGLREGQCVNFTGDPKTGKTTTALHFCAKAQKLGKKVYYVNTEGRMTEENFTGIEGLDASAISIIQTSDEKPVISAEEYLNSIEQLVKQEEDLVIIVDSVSNMVPKDELEGEIRTGVRNGLPRLLSMFFKRISGDVGRMKAILIFVTHNIANTGGSRFSPSKMADCGNMLQYQVSTNMVITHRGKWEVPKESGNHVGQVANWKVLTSAAGGIPNSTAEGWLRYGIGIDEVQELANIAAQFAMVTVKGSYYKGTVFVENKDDPAIASWFVENGADLEKDDTEALIKLVQRQGMENFCDFLRENPVLKDFLFDKIREVFL